MASVGNVQALVGGLDSALKKVLQDIFSYVLKNIRIGRPGHQEAAENFAGAFVEGTTHGTALSEFSIEHGLGRTPYLAIPVLDVQSVGSAVVPLEVTRVADGRRLYFKSTEQGIPVALYVE